MLPEYIVLYCRSNIDGMDGELSMTSGHSVGDSRFKPHTLHERGLIFALFVFRLLFVQYL